MKKWLESRIGKAIGIALACLTAAGMALSLVWMAASPSLDPVDLLMEGTGQDFLQSSTFGSQLRSRTMYELEAYRNSWMLDADGRVDRDALVDIGEVTGYRMDGLKYKLGDLLEWNDYFPDSGTDGRIVTCRKAGGGREYFYREDFQKLFEDGQLEAVWKEGVDMSMEEIFSNWEVLYEQEGIREYSYIAQQDFEDSWEYGEEITVAEAGSENAEVYSEGISEYLDGIVDPDGKRLYTDFWIYQGTQIEEVFQPQGADSLLDIVNGKQWKLAEAFAAVSAAIQNMSDMAQSYEEELYRQVHDTNVQYLYVDLDQKQAFSNKEEFRKFKTWEDSLEQFKQMGSYTWLSKGTAGTGSGSTMDGSEESWRHAVENGMDGNEHHTNYVFAVAVDTAFPYTDWVVEEKEAFQAQKSILQKAIGGFGACAVLFLASLAWLTCSAGYSKGRRGVALNFFDRWKTELAAALVLAVWIFLTVGYSTALLNSRDVFSQYLDSADGIGPAIRAQIRGYTLLIVLGAILVTLVSLWGYLSLVRRCKARTLWKDSLLYLGLKHGKRAFFALADIPRKAAVLAGFLFIQMFLGVLTAGSLMGDGFPLFLLFVIEIAGVGWIVKVAVEYHGIQKGVKKIADGDIAYQLPLKGLTWDRKTLAQDINRIGEGLDRAVEESVKSERLKTELITNVSHDIKTPLTSIINYVDLLKREQGQGEHVQEYLDILEKKTGQLKNLTEDVIEASKASTGNLTLECGDLDLVEIILQANGEFQERFEKKELALMLRLPDGPVTVWADGRRMWRILENLYQNAAKYALPRTRIYVELSVKERRAIFTMKNISEQPLNISAEELTERFVRGDSSRNTQGSGLGLSIARSLAQLQGGEFQLFLDGDLFKAEISFPLSDAL